MSIVHSASTTTSDTTTPDTTTPGTTTPDPTTPDTTTPDTTTPDTSPVATAPGRGGDGGSALVQRRFDVTGMTCSHCEGAIAAELGTVPGVVTVEVDARTGIVVLGCSTEPDPAAVAAAVHDAGYDLR